MKELIDTKALEKYYKEQIKTKDGKTYVPVSIVEKIMVLEIYKALCDGAHDNSDNSDNSGNTGSME